MSAKRYSYGKRDMNRMVKRSGGNETGAEESNSQSDAEASTGHHLDDSNVND